MVTAGAVIASTVPAEVTTFPVAAEAITEETEAPIMAAHGADTVATAATGVPEEP
jgi:hypothetical protein